MPDALARARTSAAASAAYVVARFRKSSKPVPDRVDGVRARSVVPRDASASARGEPSARGVSRALDASLASRDARRARADARSDDIVRAPTSIESVVAVERVVLGARARARDRGAARADVAERAGARAQRGASRARRHGGSKCRAALARAAMRARAVARAARRVARASGADADARPRPRRRVADAARRATARRKRDDARGATPARGKDDARALGSLLAWLRARGVEASRKTTFARGRMGVGGVAVEDMRQGEVIFSLRMRDDDDAPIALTTTEVQSERGPLRELAKAVNATRLTTRYAGVIEDDSGFPLDSTRAATLALALAREVELGSDAYWRAYVDLLPREVDSLQMWDDGELEALQGSRLIERARRRRALVLREYEATREALGETAPAYETFRWAYATVLARAFVLPDLNCMALLPGLDLYNSARDAEKCTVERLGRVEDDDDDEGEDAEAEDVAFANEGEAQVTLRVGIGGAAAGTQLFHDYADHTSGGALLEFGFVYHGERERGSGVDAVETSLERAYDALDARSRAFLAERVFGEFNVRPSLTFELSNVGGVYKPALRGAACVPLEMWRAARALALSPERALPPSLDDVLDEDTEHRARRIIVDALKAERARYAATSVEEDVRALRLALDAGVAARRTAAALEVRVGEKSLLDDVIADLETNARRERAHSSDGS